MSCVIVNTLFYGSLQIPDLLPFSRVLFHSLFFKFDHIREIYLLLNKYVSSCFSHCSILTYSISREIEPHEYGVIFLKER